MLKYSECRSAIRERYAIIDIGTFTGGEPVVDIRSKKEWRKRKESREVTKRACNFEESIKGRKE